MPADKADVLLVTVTKVESQAVLATFEAPAGHKARPVSQDGRIYFDLGICNGTRVSLTQSEMGAAGLGGAIQTVHKGIEALQPSAVIMLGIAFGVDPAWQKIGDILISENLRPYELQRVGEKQIIPRSGVNFREWGEM